MSPALREIQEIFDKVLASKDQRGSLTFSTSEKAHAWRHQAYRMRNHAALEHSPYSRVMMSIMKDEPTKVIITIQDELVLEIDGEKMAIEAQDETLADVLGISLKDG